MKNKLILSPSSSHRWLNCPGSVNAEKNYDKKHSKYATEGTIAHKLAEICLKEKKNPEHFINLKINDFIINNEMVLNVKKYIIYIKKFINNDSKQYIEKKVFFEKNYFNGTGTIDCVVINKNICHIFDLKYGKGIIINSKDNSQLNLYAIGILNLLIENNIDCNFFKLHIVQPRLNNFNFVLLEKNKLLKIKKEYHKKSLLTMKKNPKRNPGKITCRWCLAKNDCKSLYNYLNKIIFKKFENLDKKDITNEQKKSILDNYKMIQNYMENLKNEIYEKLKKGEKFYNYSINDGKIYRKWNLEQENEISQKFGKDIYVKKLINITDAEKIFDKNEINMFVIKKKSKPILNLN